MQPSNPYLDLTSANLAAACARAAEDLRANRIRTREERLELAERVRLLLLAASGRIAPAGPWFSRPEAGRDPRDFMDNLRADHEQRSSELRYRTLVVAAEWALGAQAQAWLRDGRIGEVRVYDVALESEAGLTAALGELATKASQPFRSAE